VIDVPTDVDYELRVLADFVTLARSNVNTNFKTGAIMYTPESEMPTRLYGQLLQQAEALVFMKGNIDEIDREMLYNTALSSIPGDRMKALEALTRYREGTHATLSGYCGYPGETIKAWLVALGAHGILRKSRNSTREYVWRLSDNYRTILSKYMDIKMEDLPIPASYAEDAEMGADDMEIMPMDTSEAQEIINKHKKTAQEISDEEAEQALMEANDDD
jgi:hypothetical protein